VPSPLLSLILDRIRADGPITVAEFVEQSLYHESLGYYSREQQRSGRDGDFFTSVDLGPMFGHLLAVQCGEMWRTMRAGSGGTDAAPGSAFDLVESAAGNGRLARDLLDHAAAHDRAFYDAVRLHLVERSPRARERHAEVLGPHAGRLAHSSAALPERIDGIIYANELLDALPPHLVVMRAEGLREIYVDRAASGSLQTIEGPPSSPRIREYLDSVGATLEDGWFAEVNLAAADWVRDAGRRLARGFLLLIDYGHEARRLYSASHAAGTLTTYRRHASERREDGPGWLVEPGERDITSHVDLTGTANAARDAGLDVIGMVDQTYFLLGLGLAERMFDEGSTSAGDLKRRLALKTLLLPGGIGSSHKVMIFARSVAAAPLRGLSFGARLT
jgi:SAM-dependent MidA family methyltransferase